MLLPSGNPFESHEEVLSLQPMIQNVINVLTFFSLTGGCLEGLHAFRFFFRNGHLRGSQNVCEFCFPVVKKIDEN